MRACHQKRQLSTFTTMLLKANILLVSHFSKVPWVPIMICTNQVDKDKKTKICSAGIVLHRGFSCKTKSEEMLAKVICGDSYLVRNFPMVTNSILSSCCCTARSDFSEFADSPENCAINSLRVQQNPQSDYCFCRLYPTMVDYLKGHTSTIMRWPIVDHCLLAE